MTTHTLQYDCPACGCGCCDHGVAEVTFTNCHRNGVPVGDMTGYAYVVGSSLCNLDDVLADAAGSWFRVCPNDIFAVSGTPLTVLSFRCFETQAEYQEWESEERPGLIANCTLWMPHS